MLHKPKIYLETTMFSFYYEERQHEEYQKYKAQVRQVFDLIKLGQFEPYTSPYTYQELADTKHEIRRKNRLDLIPQYGVKLIDVTPEAERMAALYVVGDAIPSGFHTDALHIAMTTVYNLDFIVSLNFQHIARPWTIERVAEINVREGYRAIGIYKPAEVL